jgi:hypothetical protein
MSIKLYLIGSLLASAALWAQAACPTWPTAARFTLDGAEVTDRRTGLVWARCSVGQSWNGNTCMGSAISLTHEAALQHAASQSGWRLPSVKELATLADKGCLNPAIDVAAFPGTTSWYYWSSSPYAGDNSLAWSVTFSGGVVSYGNRNGNGQLRMVRANQ